MCVIVYKPKGAKLDKDIIRKCWERNKDGAGYIGKNPDNEEWMTAKGIMNFDEFCEMTEGLWQEESEAVFHFRIKSKGSICEILTHPFDFSPDTPEGEDPDETSQRMLFHNGTVRFLADYAMPGMNNSDTSMLAEAILKPLDDVNVDRLLTHMANEGHGRFVTFIDGKVNLYTDNESKWVNGVWFSNLRHEPTQQQQRQSQQQTRTHSRYDYGDDYWGGDYSDYWERAIAQKEQELQELGDDYEGPEPDFDTPTVERNYWVNKIARHMVNQTNPVVENKQLLDDLINTVVAEEGLEIYPLDKLRQIAKFCIPGTADPIKAWIIKDKSADFDAFAEIQE